jgi:hypothetical protein
MLSNYSNQIAWLKGVTQVAVGSIAILSTTSAAQALNFNFSYAPGTSLEQMLAFEMAGNIWSSYITDDATLNIHIEMTGDLPEDVIGGALPGVEAQYKFDDFQKILADDRTSADDGLASSIYNKQKEFGLRLKNNGKDNQVKKIQKLNITRANAKALGIIDSKDTDLDGFIVMNNLNNKPAQWNYDLLGSSTPNNTLDFLSVAIHELGHNLGFVSGLDDPGFLNVVSGDTSKAIDGKHFTYVNVLDLFRYSTESAAQGMADMSMGSDAYFSLDGGQTRLSDFAKGENISLGGDGNQASHWREQSDPLGIMDPTLHKGQKRNIAALDLRAMDAIGWDLNYNLRGGISSNELGLDLTTLKALSEQELADRLGISVADLYNNATGSAQALTGDRNQDLETMIENSKIYEWGTNPVCNPVNGVCTTCTDNNRNGICDSKEKPWQKAMWQLGSWQKSSDLEAKQVPESSSILALLGMGLLGIISLVKGRQR